MKLIRKGSLDWNLETLGKLAIAALILIFIFAMAFRFIAIFSSSEAAQAHKSYDMLIGRIEYASDEGLQGDDAGWLQFSLPENLLYIVGFDAGTAGESIPLGKEKIPRSSDCSPDSACVCLAKAGRDLPIFFECNNIPYKTISMDVGKGTFTLPGLLWDPTNPIPLVRKSDGNYPLILTAKTCDKCNSKSAYYIEFFAEKESFLVKVQPDKNMCSDGDPVCLGKPANTPFKDDNNNMIYCKVESNKCVIAPSTCGSMSPDCDGKQPACINGKMLCEYVKTEVVLPPTGIPCGAREATKEELKKYKTCG